MTAVAVLGLGAMGSRLSTRIAAAGHEVTVWNRSPGPAERLAEQAPVRVAASRRAAVATAEVALGMVTDDEASCALWLDPEHGALDALAPGAVAVEASTISPRLAAELQAAARSRDREFLAAPVVGSRPQADTGALVVLAGGRPSALATAGPVLEAFATRVHHVATPSEAATLKLAVNGLFGIQVAAYAEIVGLLARHGLEPDETVPVLAGLPVTSPAIERALGLVTRREFEPNFPIALVAKDFRYLLDLSDAPAAELPLAEAAGAAYASGAADGRSDLDIVGIATRYL